MLSVIMLNFRMLSVTEFVIRLLSVIMLSFVIFFIS
jgi:hypothetical protein